MATSNLAISGLESKGFTGIAGESRSSAAMSKSAAPFSDLVSDAVTEMDSLQAQARVAVTGLMTGTGVDVHTAVIAAQKEAMAFELCLAVRNKAVQAYQQVMSMQF